MATLGFLIGMVILSTQNDDMADKEPIAVAAAHEYQLNQAAFVTFDFAFTYVEGKAKDLETAAKGQFESVLRYEGRYVVRGQTARYERITVKLKDGTYPKPKQIGVRQYKGGPRSVRAVCDGQKTVIDNVYVNPTSGDLEYHPTIHTGDEAFKAVVAFPLNLGVAHPNPKYHDLFDDVEDGVAGHHNNFTLESAKAVKQETRELLQVVLSMQTGTRTYWVDAKRGAVPLRVEDRNKNGALKVVLNEDMREINGAWLPFKHTVYAVSGEKKPLGSYQLVITKCDVSKNPEEKDFVLTLPRKRSVYDPANQALLAPQEELNVKRLPSPGTAAYTRVGAPRPRQTAPVFPGERRRNIWASVLFAVAFAVGLTGGVLLLVRFRRSRYQGG